jgi:hypothetical protein
VWRLVYGFQVKQECNLRIVNNVGGRKPFADVRFGTRGYFLYNVSCAVPLVDRVLNAVHTWEHGGDGGTVGSVRIGFHYPFSKSDFRNTVQLSKLPGFSRHKKARFR